MTYDSSGTYRYRFPTVAQQTAEFRAERPDCPICGDVATDIDHDHSTGTVRGHLCRQCNLGLGHFGDDPIRMKAAILYLENYDLTGAPVTPEWSQSRAFPGKMIRMLRAVPDGALFAGMEQESEVLEIIDWVNRWLEWDLSPVVFS